MPSILKRAASIAAVVPPPACDHSAMMVAWTPWELGSSTPTQLWPATIVATARPKCLASW